jgi:hypothetical protein
MRLRVGDTFSAKRGNLAITGTVTRVEADGFWIESPDGMSYRFGLASEPLDDTRDQIDGS